MPYHLLHETQAAKDRLLAHRMQATCMAPIPLLQQQQPSTLSKYPADASPIAPSPSASRDALSPATLPPLPQQLQTLKNSLPTPRSLLASPLYKQIPTISAPQARRPLHTLSRTTSPLFLIPVIILIFILLVRLELRFLNAHATLFDRFDNWFRRFHKGTSRFRHKHPHLPSSKLHDDNKPTRARPKRQSGQLAAPGWMAKQAVVTAGKWVTWAVRRSVQQSEGSREVLVRSFDGLPIAPVATRRWELPLPHMTAAPIAYGVPPPLKPPRARRSTIALNVLEPEAALEGEVISVLRQQAMADEEASTAADPLMMGTPRGQCGGEERDLEALEGSSVNVGFRGGEGLVVRRGWNGGVEAGGGEIV